jgi:anti-sigma factor RsiW
MSVCDEIKLLLGPFDDGELEPHEMEDVALHVVSCADCKAALEDCRSLGVALRDVVRPPSIEGFTQTVMARIERLPIPMHVWLRRHFASTLERFGAGFERFGASVAIAAVGAVTTIMTVWVVTPYAHRFNHQAPVQVAQRDDIAPSNSVPGPDPDMEPGRHDVFDQVEPPPSSASGIPPMIAVSDDPTTATTVIYMPNQQ